MEARGSHAMKLRVKKANGEVTKLNADSLEPRGPLAVFVSNGYIYKCDADFGIFCHLQTAYAK